MFSFLKTFVTKATPKSTYTICAKCTYYKSELFSAEWGIISKKCYAKIVLKKYLNFITGEKYEAYSGTPELCSEKNTGHCPDFKKRRSLFNS